MNPIQLEPLIRIFLTLGVFYFIFNMGYVVFAMTRDQQRIRKEERQLEIAEEHLKLSKHNIRLNERSVDLQYENKIKTCTQYLEELDRVINDQLKSNRWILDAQFEIAQNGLKKQLEKIRREEAEAVEKSIKTRIDS